MLARATATATATARRAMSTVSEITARAIVYSSYGEPLDTIACHSYKLPSKPRNGNDVLLQSLACPLNPSDINQIQGVYPSRPLLTKELGTIEPSAVCGNEGLFKVLATGSEVSDLKAGDWVIPSNVNFGTWRSHALTDAENLTKLPNDGKLSVAEAATITVNPSSAYQMLTLYVDLKPGDWFIQNGGNSQVGRAAIQIGKKLGLKSISVVRDRSDLKELKEELTKLGATHVITEEENGNREFVG
ncbi:unnamed protein product [Ambrosiozyma monospora]|uniref:Unnamed protein product n=1 Tax=Ambrosiozyma monospora TaxID=43982 RepID=A0A9W6T414_AMBMO|nr:unnamed protein product [Ambrosiozyma monospora]